MKPYWLFAGNIYYPSGGMGDFVGSFDTLEEAKNADRPGEPGYRWAHIYDADSGAIVASFDDDDEEWSDYHDPRPV